MQAASSASTCTKRDGSGGTVFKIFANAYCNGSREMMTAKVPTQAVPPLQAGIAGVSFAGAGANADEAAAAAAGAGGGKGEQE